MSDDDSCDGDTDPLMEDDDELVNWFFKRLQDALAPVLMRVHTLVL